MEPPTETEESLIKQLRTRVSDLNLESDGRSRSDMFYLRWIRARDQNLNQAESMLRKSMEWRKSFGMDKLSDWNPPEQLFNQVVIQFLGYSKNGCPTFYIPVGSCHFVRTCELGLKEDCIKHLLQMFVMAIEEVSNGSAGSGEPSSGQQAIILGDFKDFALTTILYPSFADLVFQAAKYFEANFPETMFKFIFFNSCRAVQIALSIVRPIASQRTLSKLEVHTVPAYQLLDNIHALLPEEQLPPFLGGSARHVEDQMLAKFPSFEVTRRKALEDMQAVLKAEAALIAAGDQLFLEIDIKVPGSKLAYSVSVEKYDIDFMILKGAKQVVAKTRVGQNCESGEIVCETPGVVIVRFDNLYSKYRSKQVRFKINVIEP